MRTYGQYCALAKALDVVGDRWTLLIVRELMLRGDSRYTDLRNGLPGIATNLLADRLRDLEREGIIERTEAPPPIATALFRLTPRGRELQSVLDALARWGAPLMVDGPAAGDDFRSHWLAWPAEMMLSDRQPLRAPTELELRTPEGSVTVRAGGGAVEVRAGAADRADVVLEAEPHLLLGLLSGRIDVDEARTQGLRLEGDESALARVRSAA